MLRPVGPLVLLLVAAAAVAVPASSSAGGGSGSELWVDGGRPGCSDSYPREQAASAATPWCSISRAAALATTGDTVRILPWTYRGSVRPASSGTTFVAEDG